MSISDSHTNRGAHNWLIYDLGDRYITKNSDMFKGTIYDLGAGESPYRNFFLKHSDRYIAVDWVGSPHEILVDLCADLNQPLPIQSENADTVVSISVIEHLCEPQVMLNEAFRILRPGGRLFLQVPWQWGIHESPHDYFRYSPYGLKYLTEKAGFTSVIVDSQCGFFTMWILKFNYFTLRFVRGPRPLCQLLRVFFVPIWYFGQLLAPFLDKFDRDPMAESAGYFVTAMKT